MPSIAAFRLSTSSGSTARSSTRYPRRSKKKSSSGVGYVHSLAPPLNSAPIRHHVAMSSGCAWPHNHTAENNTWTWINQGVSLLFCVLNFLQGYATPHLMLQQFGSIGQRDTHGDVATL